MQAKINNMATKAKTQRGKTKKKQIISTEHRKKIAHAYYQLYRMFVLKNLLSGMTLGAASHNALQLVRAKLSTMEKNNSVTKYLLRIHARHSKRIAKRIMTGKYRNARATAKPETRTKIASFMPKLIASSLNTFATMLALYKPKTVAQQQKPNIRQKNILRPAMLLQIKLAEQQRQRAA